MRSLNFDLDEFDSRDSARIKRLLNKRRYKQSRFDNQWADGPGSGNRDKDYEDYDDESYDDYEDYEQYVDYDENEFDSYARDNQPF